MIRAFLPAMLEGRGSIVNMSSAVSSIRGVPNRYVYGATGRGDRAHETARRRFHPPGIRANAICPGTIHSPRSRSASRRNRRRRQIARRGAPFRRPPADGRLGTPRRSPRSRCSWRRASRATSPARRTWWMGDGAIGGGLPCPAGRSGRISQPLHEPMPCMTWRIIFDTSEFRIPVSMVELRCLEACCVEPNSNAIARPRNLFCLDKQP